MFWVKCLPWHTHSSWLAPLTDTLPLRGRSSLYVSVELCFSEDNIANFASWHDLYYSSVSSPTGLDAHLYCARFDWPLSRLTSKLIEICSAQCRCTLFDSEHDQGMCVKSDQIEIAEFTSYDVDFIIESMCICWLSVFTLIF